MAATPQPPDLLYPVYDPHPRPLALLAYWLIPGLKDPHWSAPPWCILTGTAGPEASEPEASL